MSYTLMDFTKDIQEMHDDNIDTASQFPALYEKLKDSELPLIKCVHIYNRIILPEFALSMRQIANKCDAIGKDYTALNLSLIHI